MAQITIRIELDSAAFDPKPGPEVARILRHLAAVFHDTLVVAPRGPEALPVRDINGNTIGDVAIIPN